MKTKFAIVLLLLITPAAAHSGESLPAIQQQLSALERQAVRLNRPSDVDRIRKLRDQASQLMGRLHRAAANNHQTVAMRQRAMKLLQDLNQRIMKYGTDTGSPLGYPSGPRQPAAPPRRNFDLSPEASAIRDRYKELPIPVRVPGRGISVTEVGATVVALEVARFTQQLAQVAGHLEKDLALAKRKQATGLQSHLERHVGDSLNKKIERSRKRLQRAIESTVSLVKHGMKKPLEYSGEREPESPFSFAMPIITVPKFKRNPELDYTFGECLKWASDLARAGVSLERQVGGDVTPWLEWQKETAALAKQMGIPLEYRAYRNEKAKKLLKEAAAKAMQAGK